MKLHIINTGFFKLDGGAMFGVVPKSIWSRTNPADEKNLCTWASRCLLIEEEDRLILVDTGLGYKQDDKFFSHYYHHGEDTLITSLAKIGYSPNDITDVILTHLHFDHVGGAVSKSSNGEFKLTCEKANYWTNKEHWDWALQPNAREKASFLKENILPIQDSGKLKFIPVEDGFAFSKNVKIRFVFGHTHAMMLPEINCLGKTYLFMADLLPSTGHIPLPYIPSFDVFPLTTLDEKQRILQEAESKNIILILQHDPIVECCSLTQTDKGIRLKDTFSLSSTL